MFTHLFRHAFANDMKAKGVNDEITMTLGGWKSPAVMMRYGRAQKAERAEECLQGAGPQPG